MNQWPGWCRRTKYGIFISTNVLSQNGVSVARTNNFITLLKKSSSRAIGINDKELDNKTVKINIRWDGYKCKPIVTNNGDATIRLKNIILFDVVEHGLSPNTPIYGEGFQKLSQTAGTLKNPLDPEGLELQPGETWNLEEFAAISGTDRNSLFDKVAGFIQNNDRTRGKIYKCQI